MRLLDTVAVAAVAAGALWLGAGTAHAVPDVVDRPYQDARRIIERSGGNPVIATRTGAGLSDDDCLVTNMRSAAVRRPGSRGRTVANSDVMVALNCYGVLAGPGSAGNSALSPVGREAKSKAEQQQRRRQAELAQAHAETAD